MEGRNQLKEGLRRTEKVVPHSLGLMDFAIRLVKSILNLPNKQVKFLGNFMIILQKNCNLS